jgi:hypothetical protein
MIVSFAWTTPALLAGAKTMSRREWKPEHALRFHRGDVIDAWDKSPRTGKGKPVAKIRLMRDVYAQNTRELTDLDYVREGFTWLTLFGAAEDRTRVQEIWDEWRIAPRVLWVLEFEVLGRLVVPSGGASPSKATS